MRTKVDGWNNSSYRTFTLAVAKLLRKRKLSDEELRTQIKELLNELDEKEWCDSWEAYADEMINSFN